MQSNGLLRWEQHPAGSDEAYAQELLDIFEEAIGAGGFKREVTLPSGEVVTHSFWLAVGWGSSFYQSEYVAHFQRDLPAWAMLQHPYHISCMCRLSAKYCKPLPEEAPVKARCRR